METTVQPLRVGIIGAGGMGGTHARQWTRVPGARVVAVADPQAHKAEALAARHEGAKTYAGIEALLADGGGVDVVSVCVPTVSHRTVSEAALRAGIHTFCEKPMGLSIAECDAMIAARDASGGRALLSVGQVVRFFPEYANAKRQIEQGAVGKPAAVRVRRGGGFPHTDTDWFADPAKSGGVIFDLLVHDLDWLLWCFGPVTRVYARALTERLAEKTVDHIDYALLTLRHESGVISHAEGTWADPGGFVTAFEVAGDGGLLTHDSRRAVPLTKAIRAEGQGRTAGVMVPSSPLTPDDDPYFKEILAFARSIREGTPLAVTPEEARRAVTVAEAARESARTGKAVEVKA
jgi:predicted dehydrogenase